MSTPETSWLRKIIGVKMSPEAHLIDTWWFRGAIIAPLAIGLLVGWHFTGDLELQFERSPEGMNNFLQMFKLPIGIASLALPIVAVVAANHRSMQTAKQIAEQNAQNIFSNHLEHRDFFAKFIDERMPFDKITIDTARLYEKLFPKAVDGDLKPNFDLVNEVLSEIIHTLFKVGTQSKRHLNEKNFKLPKKSAESLELSIRETERIIRNKVFSVPVTDTSKLFDDPISVVRTVRSRYLMIGQGLVQSANFHRYYGNRSKVDSILKICGEIDDLLCDLSGIYPLYSSIKLATEEYLTKDGNIKEESGKSEDQFFTRLSDIKESMVKNNQNMEIIRKIFENHIEQNHRVIFYSNAPEEWKKYLDLSEKEESLMIRHKYGRR